MVIYCFFCNFVLIYLLSYKIVMFILKKYIKVLIIICLVKRLLFFISHQKTNFVPCRIFEYNNFDSFSIGKNSWKFMYRASFINFSISIYSWRISWSLMIDMANIIIIMEKNILHVIIIKHSFCIANNLFLIGRIVKFV